MRTCVTLLLALACLLVCSATHASGDFAPFPLGIGGPRAQLGALVTVPDGERFLATWYDPEDKALHARLLARDGTPAGPDVVLAPSPSPVRPAAVFNPRPGEYLVVWQGGGSLPHVWGQRIGADGAPVGGMLAVSGTYSAQGAPSLAVDAGTGRMLAVWDDDVNRFDTDWDIVGLLMEPDGTPLGGDLFLTYASRRQLAPRVACDSTQGVYLVVWEDERELFGAGTDRLIVAQALDRDGNLLGEPLMLARTAADHAGLAVAAEPGTGEFVVVWVDRGEGERGTEPGLRARRVNPRNGTMGPAVALGPSGVPSEPALVFHPPTRRFLLAWTDRREFVGAASLALARVLGAEGAPVGDEFDLAVEAYGPALAAPEQGPVLAGWSDPGRGGLYAAWIDPAATPPPQPHVRDERPYTSDATRLGAFWSVVGFAGGVRAYRTAVGTTPGAEDVAPWVDLPPDGEGIAVGAREGLRLEEGKTYYFSVVAVGQDGLTSRVGVSPGTVVDLTAPRVTITSAPPAVVKDTVAVFAFEGTDNLAPATLLRYRWRLNSGAWSLPSFGRTVRLERLAPGPYRFEVQALDPADNAGPVAKAIFTVAP